MSDSAEIQNTPSLPAISTKNLPIQKIRIERKFIYPVGYKEKRRKSISTKTHPTTIRKKEAKRKLLYLVGKGMTLPSAIAALCVMMEYKSRSTMYKWLEEDEEFKEDVICRELCMFGLLEVLEMQVAKGGQLIRETIEKERRIGKTSSKIRSYVSRRWAAINGAVLINALRRRGERLRKIDKLSRDYDEFMGRE